MNRTQIYLASEEVEVLAKLAKESGVTRSELIRGAIRRAYIEKLPDDAWQRGLDVSAGAWQRSEDSDSPEGSTGAAYVEALRPGRWGRRLE